MLEFSRKPLGRGSAALIGLPRCPRTDVNCRRSLRWLEARPVGGVLVVGKVGNHHLVDETSVFSYSRSWNHHANRGCFASYSQTTPSPNDPPGAAKFYWA